MSDSDWKINEQLNRMEELLLNLEQRVTNVEKELKEIKTSAQNMDNHIGFVEHIYDNIKYPFAKALSWINGGEVNPLLIEDIHRSEK